MKKLIAWGLFLGICFLSGALLSYHAPKVEAWLILLIEKESAQSGVVGVLPTRLSLGFFPPRLKLEDVRVLPQNELRDQLEPFTVGEISLSPAIGALLRGNIRAGKLFIKDAQILARSPAASPSPAGELPDLYALSETFRELPLDILTLEGVDVTVLSSSEEILLEAQGIHLESFLSWGQVHVATSVEDFSVAALGGTLGARLGVKAEIFEDHIRMEEITVEQEGLSLSAEGPVRLNGAGLPAANMEYKILLEGGALTQYLLENVPEAPLPEFQGTVEVEGRFNTGSPFYAQYSLQTSGLTIERYTLGSLKSRGDVNSERLRSDQVSVTHPGGRVELKDLVWLFEREEQKESLRAEVQIRGLGLSRLLVGLGVRGVPVQLDINGTLPCEAQILTGFLLECQGRLSLFDLVVEGGERPIVEAPRFLVDGRVRVDGEKVQYDAALQVGESSQGRSHGRIEYAKGFDLNFETPSFHFEDLQSLSGLKLEGSSALKGRTWGDSDKGRVEIEASSPHLTFEDYVLGAADFKLTYRQNVLGFSNIEGRLRKTRYSGEVALNLAENQIRGEITLPYFELQDLQHSFHRNLEIPVDIQGTGSGGVNFHGPLQLEALSYELHADSYRGKIGPEYFDQAKLQLESTEGRARFRNSTVRKGTTVLAVEGEFKPFSDVDLDISSEQIQLQDSTVLNQLTQEIMGRAKASLQVKGAWEDITTTLSSELQGVRIGGRSMGDSSLQGGISSQTAQLTADLMDSTLQLNLIYPFGPGTPFALSMNASSWDFTRFLSSLRKELSGEHFESAATFHLELYSPNGDPWKSEGQLTAPLIRVRRGPSELKNTAPLRLTFEDGNIAFNNFELSGEDGFLRITDRPQSERPIDIELQSKLQLHFMSLFTPFLEDIQGTLSTSVNMKMAPDDFQILGSAYIERGYFKSADFPHPVEELQADLLFNHRRILLNSARGVLAQGRVFASGEVEMRGLFDLPTAIDIHVDNVRLEIPADYQTRGTGHLKISGNWFPFTLGGEYSIHSGRITDSFGGSQESTVRRSQFLPPDLLLEQQAAPFLLDLAVKTESPLVVDNDLLDGRVRAQLRITGTADRPSLSGEATIVPPSTLLFRDNEFQVETGQIRFEGRSEINPSLYISARTRLNEYDIQMLIQGTASRPEISLSSQPGLPEQDIITLLALGVPSQAGSEGLESGDMARQSTFQISALLFSDFGRQFKSQYNFDLQISPIFDEESNATAHKVTLGRQITPKLGAVASYEQGKSPKTDVKVKYQMNNQVFLVGSFENRPFTESIDVPETQDSNIFGIDLEYRVDFK